MEGGCSACRAYFLGRDESGGDWLCVMNSPWKHACSHNAYTYTTAPRECCTLVPGLCTLSLKLSVHSLPQLPARQGSNFRFGTYTDSGSGTALISFQASGGGWAYWDSNDYHFDRGGQGDGKSAILAADTTFQPATCSAH